uniref:Putative secreted protein n=1 Tax=Anopheles darlingi TaxID=43151 RepID=A0A2M4DLR1_ANODA
MFSSRTAIAIAIECTATACTVQCTACGPVWSHSEIRDHVSCAPGATRSGSSEQDRTMHRAARRHTAIPVVSPSLGDEKKDPTPPPSSLMTMMHAYTKSHGHHHQD